MKNSWRVALAQLSIADGNKAVNLAKMEAAIRQASKEAADILVFPELMLSGLVSNDEMLVLAETRDGNSYKAIRDMVAESPVRVVYSFPEYVSDQELYITTCLMGKQGEAIAYYRKTHLFSEENRLFSPGDSWTTINLGSIQAGILTCYDIEFPEPARTLALEGVNVIIVNSANMTPYEYAHQLFIRARAAENQCFVIYCNRVGSNEFHEYHGQSAVIGPDGKLVMELDEDREMVKIVDLSLDELEKSKSTFHYLQERRNELYK